MANEPRWWQGLTQSGGYTVCVHLSDDNDRSICFRSVALTRDTPVVEKKCDDCLRKARMTPKKWVQPP